MDTINEEFFASDSLMTADDCIPFTEHYPNGAIKLKGCQGHFGPFGVPIGTWTYYDSTGSMILKENYFHDMDSGYVRKEIFIAGQVSITYNIRYDPHYGELEDTLQVY